MLVDPRTPIDLVDADRVVEQPGTLPNIGQDARLMCFLAPALSAIPNHTLRDAAAKIRVRGFDGKEQILRGMSFEPVIGITEHQPCPPGERDPGIPRSAATTGVHVESVVGDAGVVTLNTGNDRCGVVRRGVVDDDDLDIAQGLLAQ